MRSLALLTAAASALGAHAETHSNATQEVEMSSSQMLSGLSQIIGSQRDLESIQSLPKYKQVLLCMGTESSGSVDKAALKLALGVDGQADVDNVNAYLQQRCHANGPVTNMRAIAEPDLKFPSVFNGKNMCNLFQKADNILDSALIGNLAEALGFDNPLSKKFGRLVYSKCGVMIHPHPNPSRPVNPNRLKPDPCQAAVPTGSGGSFTLPQNCGGSAVQPGSNRPGGDQSGGDQSGGDQSGGDQPGGDQPGGNQSGGDQPGGDQPGGNQPGRDQPGGDQPGGNQPGGDQPGGDQPGGDQSGGNQPGGNQPGGDQPEGDQPGPYNSDSG